MSVKTHALLIASQVLTREYDGDNSTCSCTLNKELEPEPSSKHVCIEEKRLCNIQNSSQSSVIIRNVFSQGIRRT